MSTKNKNNMSKPTQHRALDDLGVAGPAAAADPLRRDAESQRPPSPAPADGLGGTRDASDVDDGPVAQAPCRKSHRAEQPATPAQLGRPARAATLPLHVFDADAGRTMTVALDRADLTFGGLQRALKAQHDHEQHVFVNHAICGTQRVASAAPLAALLGVPPPPSAGAASSRPRGPPPIVWTTATPMRLYVESVSGDKTFAVDVSPKMTVAGLNRALQDHDGVQQCPDGEGLFFAGTLLDEARAIGSFTYEDSCEPWISGGATLCLAQGCEPGSSTDRPHPPVPFSWPPALSPAEMEEWIHALADSPTATTTTTTTTSRAAHGEVSAPAQLGRPALAATLPLHVFDADAETIFFTRNQREYTDARRLLGGVLDSSLCFHKHVDKVVAETHRRTGQLRAFSVRNRGLSGRTMTVALDRADLTAGGLQRALKAQHDHEQHVFTSPRVDTLPPDVEPIADDQYSPPPREEPSLEDTLDASDMDGAVAQAPCLKSHRAERAEQPATPAQLGRPALAATLPLHVFDADAGRTMTVALDRADLTAGGLALKAQHDHDQHVFVNHRSVDSYSTPLIDYLHLPQPLPESCPGGPGSSAGVAADEAFVSTARAKPEPLPVVWTAPAAPPGTSGNSKAAKATAAGSDGAAGKKQPARKQQQDIVAGDANAARARTEELAFNACSVSVRRKINTYATANDRLRRELKELRAANGNLRCDLGSLNARACRQNDSFAAAIDKLHREVEDLRADNDDLKAYSDRLYDDNCELRRRATLNRARRWFDFGGLRGWGSASGK